MSKVIMRWHAEPLSVYEWSRLDLGAMLHQHPTFSLFSEEGVLIDIHMPCQMPRLILVDGTSLSVQAGVHSYASPRDNHGPYSSVEVGFPSTTPRRRGSSIARTGTTRPTPGTGTSRSRSS